MAALVHITGVEFDYFVNYSKTSVTWIGVTWSNTAQFNSLMLLLMVFWLKYLVMLIQHPNGLLILRPLVQDCLIREYLDSPEFINLVSRVGRLRLISDAARQDEATQENEGSATATRINATQPSPPLSLVEIQERKVRARTELQTKLATILAENDPVDTTPHRTFLRNTEPENSKERGQNSNTRSGAGEMPRRVKLASRWEKFFSPRINDTVSGTENSANIGGSGSVRALAKSEALYHSRSNTMVDGESKDVLSSLPDSSTLAPGDLIRASVDNAPHFPVPKSIHPMPESLTIPTPNKSTLWSQTPIDSTSALSVSPTSSSDSQHGSSLSHPTVHLTSISVVSSVDLE